MWLTGPYFSQSGPVDLAVISGGVNPGFYESPLFYGDGNSGPVADVVEEPVLSASPDPASIWPDWYTGFAEYQDDVWAQVNEAALTGITGTLSSTLQDAALVATGTLGIAGSLTSTLDAATLTSTAGLRIAGSTAATLSDVTLSSVGTLRISGALNVSLDAATLAASGTLASTGITGSLNATLDPVTLSSAGALRIAGQASATLAASTLSSAGSLRIAGTVGVTLDAATLSATGSTRIAGTLNATLGDLTGSGVSDLDIGGGTTAMLGPLTLVATGTLATAGGSGGIPLVEVVLSDAHKPKWIRDRETARLEKARETSAAAKRLAKQVRRIDARGDDASELADELIEEAFALTAKTIEDAEYELQLRAFDAKQRARWLELLHEAQMLVISTRKRSEDELLAIILAIDASAT